MAKRQRPYDLDHIDADELRERVIAALKRIDDLPTMDDPDSMVACISDVEAMLKGETL